MEKKEEAIDMQILNNSIKLFNFNIPEKTNLYITPDAREYFSRIRIHLYNLIEKVIELKFGSSDIIPDDNFWNKIELSGLMSDRINNIERVFDDPINYK